MVAIENTWETLLPIFTISTGGILAYCIVYFVGMIF